MIALNENAERRRRAYLRREVIYPSTLEFLVRQDAIMAVIEGDGVNACPFADGIARRIWIAAYYGQKKRPVTLEEVSSYSAFKAAYGGPELPERFMLMQPEPC